MEPRYICHDCYKREDDVGLIPKTIAAIRLCDSCFDKHSQICRSCFSVSEWVDKDEICALCLYGARWKVEDEDIAYYKPPKCKSCGERTTCNDEGICKICFTERAIELRGKNDVKLCPHCKRVFIPFYSLRCRNCTHGTRLCKKCKEILTGHHTSTDLCYKCMPVCKGCDTKYEGKDGSPFCEECQDKIKRGLCVSCVEPKQTNENARCRECEERATTGG